MLVFLLPFQICSPVQLRDWLGDRRQSCVVDQDEKCLWAHYSIVPQLALLVLLFLVGQQWGLRPRTPCEHLSRVQLEPPPDDLDQFPDSHVVWNEELGLVQHRQLLLPPKPLYDTRHLGNKISSWTN